VVAKIVVYRASCGWTACSLVRLATAGVCNRFTQNNEEGRRDVVGRNSPLPLCRKLRLGWSALGQRRRDSDVPYLNSVLHAPRRALCVTGPTTRPPACLGNVRLVSLWLLLLYTHAWRERSMILMAIKIQEPPSMRPCIFVPSLPVASV
jgi:hypothetical protein